MAEKKKSSKKLESSEKQLNPVKTPKKKVAKKATKKEEKPNNPDLIKFGEKIKERRIELGYSNSDYLAFEINVARSQLNRYEAGLDDLRLTTLLKLLRHMGLKPSEFFKDFD